MFKRLNKPPNREYVSNIVCFGEVLWDIFPGSAKAGGAPMNVAYHLHKLGLDSQIISRIGNDFRGSQLLNILNNWDISTNLCQIDSYYPTSVVQATMDQNYEMAYEILFPVAWDFIEWRDEFEQILSTADAFIFGSLITRNSVSYNTLLRMLETYKYKVFDVNLRYPYYSFEIVDKLLKKTDLLKLNHTELDIICNWIKPECKNEEEKIRLLQTNYCIKEIIVTKGGRGASFHSVDAHYESASYKISVADTVGSGDAFLAAFLATKFKGNCKIENQLDYASALGAYVATKEGACPNYSLVELDQFIYAHNHKEVKPVTTK